MSTLKKEPAALKLADIRVQKLLAEHPEMFSNKPREKIDLRELQTKLHREAQEAKSPAARRARKIAKFKAAWRFRTRVKAPTLAGCSVIDTQKSDGKLYFELSNGQCVRADRFFPSVRSDSDAGTVNKADWRRFTGKRRQNVHLRRLVLAEVEKNANREASK